MKYLLSRNLKIAMFHAGLDNRFVRTNRSSLLHRQIIIYTS